MKFSESFGADRQDAKEPPELLPRHIFNAGANLDKGEEKNLNRNIERWRSYRKSDLPFNEYELVSDFSDEYVNWGKEELGLDLSRRVPKTEKVHIVKKGSKEEREILKDNSPLCEDEVGFCFRGPSEIIIWDVNDSILNKTSLVHEMAHVFGFASFFVKNKREIDFRLHRNGYFRQPLTKRKKRLPKDAPPMRDFEGFNEIVADLISIDFLNFYEEKKVDDKVKGNVPKVRGPLARRVIDDEGCVLYPTGYVYGVIAMELIFDAISKKTGESIKNIKKNLYRGYFEGDAQALSVFKDNFSLSVLKKLAAINPDKDLISSDDKEIIEILEECGIDVEEYKDLAAAYDQGLPVEFPSGTKIRDYDPEKKD
jgi:hypothetical protein